MGKVEEISRQVLRCLLQDFQARELGADALEQEYEGVPIKDLKKRCFQQDHTSTSVDVDLALKGLEDKELIGTGPMDVYSDISPSVNAFAVYSKREYAYLTARGYKAAR